MTDKKQPGAMTTALLAVEALKIEKLLKELEQLKRDAAAIRR